MGVIKDRLFDALAKLPTNGVLKTSRADTTGSILGRIFVWQEALKYAEKQLDGAWKSAVLAKLIPDDDTLRDGSAIGDEKIVAESKHFSIVTKVGSPRELFQLDEFITALAEEYKLDPGALNALALTCKKDSKAPLSKRVLEV
jgi:hypothetical protein